MSKIVLITGASRGIGFELAKKFAQDGFDQVLVARSEEKLLEIKNYLETQYRISVDVIAKDLSVKDAAEEIYRTLSSNGKHIDILVNNAGLGDFGEFAQTDWNKQYNMIQLNITALVHLTRLFLNPMLEQGYGRILNVASAAAFQPGPFMSVYYATKAFVLSFSEALARELKGSGVTVTALCPGPTQTDFITAASMENSNLLNSLKMANAEEVAAYGYHALMKGTPVMIHGFANKLLIFSIRFAPRSWVREITYKLQHKVT